MFKQSKFCLDKVLKVSNINPHILKAEYAVRGSVLIKAEELNSKLSKKDHGLPYDNIVFCNIGNPQQLGQKPITFNRNVISCE